MKLNRRSFLLVPIAAAIVALYESPRESWRLIG